MRSIERVLLAGLARSTVAQRVDKPLANGLVHDTGGSVSTGGRPPAVLVFNRDAGVVLVADLGATHARVAVCDLIGTPPAERAGGLDIAFGRDRVLEWADDWFAELLEDVGRSAGDIGHIRATTRDDVVCRCGNIGCLEAIAGGIEHVLSPDAVDRSLAPAA